MYKLIAQYRFTNSTYFKVSKIIRKFYIGFSLIAFILNSCVIFQKDASVDKVEIDHRRVSYGGKHSNRKIELPFTLVYVKDKKIELEGDFPEIWAKDNIKLNYNVLGKITSIENKNSQRITCKFPNDLSYIMLIIFIPVCFTFIYEEYQNYGERLALNFFTSFCVVLILLYYLLL